MPIDEHKIDEAVLALLYLTLQDGIASCKPPILAAGIKVKVGLSGVDLNISLGDTKVPPVQNPPGR